MSVRTPEGGGAKLRSTLTGKPALLPGTFVDVRIFGRTLSDVVLVPRHAVRNGGEVWCPRRKTEALVSVVERDGPHGQLRYVQWCSLIDLDDCGQECMCQLAER